MPRHDDSEVLPPHMERRRRVFTLLPGDSDGELLLQQRLDDVPEMIGVSGCEALIQARKRKTYQASLRPTVRK